ncbi:SCAN domain-containing protein 3-like [Alligator mississippiensis]|uniref:SCAN domain-containing protein 3-like n=1 Tax=Alligator mississippiensis TaxID=8496 RepID=A0A151P329_ALLMI|nr:SCAN domain-containing protein 3-like [Alligator mississippiensis]
MVAKTKKPHTIAENLVIPAAFRIAEIMLGKTEVDKIKTIPHSNDTMTRRIDDMAEDIIKQISEKVIQKQQFTLQIDESKDVSTYSQLMMFVRYIDDEDEQGIQEQIYGCKELDTKRTGEDIFKILNEHIVKNGLSWEWCVSVCTDGSAATVGRRSGLVARLRAINPSIKWNHCIIYRQALAAKRLNEDLNSVLGTAVKPVNFLKARALNSRLFRSLCHDMGSEHTTVLLHTEVQWLSCGRLLNRWFELRYEVTVSLREMKSEFLQHFEDKVWICKLVYLCDIFDKINDLNLQLLGYNTNIFTLQDKLSEFCEENEIPLNESVKENIKEHLVNLEPNFEHYFPNVEEHEDPQKL